MFITNFQINNKKSDYSIFDRTFKSSPRSLYQLLIIIDKDFFGIAYDINILNDKVKNVSFIL